MSRQQFRLLVVLSQFLFYGTMLTQSLTDGALPPELLDFVTAEPSLLDGGAGGDAPNAWLADVLLAVTSVASLIAAVGLCLGRAWGRRLFLVCFLLSFAPVALTPVYVDTSWTVLLASLYGASEGMILALVYFSHLRRMFDGDEDDDPDEDRDATA